MQTTMTPYNVPAHALLDHLRELQGFTTDAQLAAALEVAPPVISKMRYRKLPVGPTILIKMHENYGVSFKTMRELLAQAKEQ